MRQNLTNVTETQLDRVDSFYVVGSTTKEGLIEGRSNVKIDLKKAISEGGGSGGGGDDSSTEFGIKVRYDDFFDEHWVSRQDLDTTKGYTLDEIFELSDNSLQKLIDNYCFVADAVKNHEGSREWYLNAQPYIFLTKNDNIEKMYPSREDEHEEYGIFLKLTIKNYYDYSENTSKYPYLYIEGTNLGGGSIGVPQLGFLLGEDGKWYIKK